jgi:hypothetical protein
MEGHDVLVPWCGGGKNTCLDVGVVWTFVTRKWAASRCRSDH